MQNGEPKPFKFENMWLKSPGFVEMVKMGWESFSAEGKPGQRLRLKPKMLSEKLWMWNKEVSGNIDIKKKHLIEEISFWDSNDEQRCLLENEKQMRKSVKQDFAKIACMEEIKWKQKAKVQWLKEGDRNTRFFHRITSARRNTNFIYSLVDDDGEEVDSAHLKDHVAAYFMKLYKDSGLCRPKLNGVQIKRISSFMRNWLEHPFEEEKVKKVVWSIEDEKALGPDGFSMAFFKRCWEVIKKDLMDTLKKFHEEAFLDLGSNFISLIPKSEDANKISEFRPITLVNSTYKILSKTLSCRLKEALKEVISPNQIAFLEGRQSVDGVLVANECLDAILRVGRQVFSVN